MSELNIITANLSHGKTYVTASRYMEDYGQVLKIEGMDLPSVYQVDFSNNLLRGTSMTVLGDADGVAIPDEYISTGRDVYAFLYLTGDMWGRTIATIRIPNKTRPTRTDAIPTPTQQSVIDQTIAALNDAVERAEEAEETLTGASATATTLPTGSEATASYDGGLFTFGIPTGATGATGPRGPQGLKGNKGNKGDDAVYLRVTSEEAIVHCDADGYIKADTTVGTTFKLCKGNSVVDIDRITGMKTIDFDDGTGIFPSSDTDGRFTYKLAAGKRPENDVTAFTYTVKGGNYTLTHGFTITFVRDGEKGDKGDTGETGPTGATPNLTIGTVTTLTPDDDATATITGTAENPVLSFGIPQGKTGEVTLEDYYKAFPVDTATGAVASFSDGANIPVKSLVVDIDPVQDLHGYDNPWPSGGGKNICPDKKVQGGFESVYIGQDNTTDFPFALTGGQQYTLSVTTSKSLTVYLREENMESGTIIGRWSPLTFTPSTTGNYRIALTASGLIPSDVSNIQLESGTTATDYAPYSNICPISGWTQVNVNHSDADMTNPTTITINLGQTVYGGKLDVLTGELVVDRYLYVYDGTETDFIKSGIALNGFYNFWANTTPPHDVPKMLNYGSGIPITSEISSMFKMTRVANEYKQNYGYCFLDSGMNFNCDPDVFGTTVDSFKAKLAEFYANGTPVSVFVKIATPITIQLTPNQVNSLYGVNNIWADSGDTEVEYRADTKLFIERLTAPDSADMVAEANITSGKYFMVGNSLYKATANIANGAQIIVGTNCIRKSLSEALNEINA